MTSGMHRRPFEGRHLVVECVFLMEGWMLRKISFPIYFCIVILMLQFWRVRLCFHNLVTLTQCSAISWPSWPQLIFIHIYNTIIHIIAVTNGPSIWGKALIYYNIHNTTGIILLLCLILVSRIFTESKFDFCLIVHLHPLHVHIGYSSLCFKWKCIVSWQVSMCIFNKRDHLCTPIIQWNKLLVARWQSDETRWNWIKVHSVSHWGVICASCMYYLIGQKRNCAISGNERIFLISNSIELRFHQFLSSWTQTRHCYTVEW